MIESRLIVTKRTAPVPHGMVAAEHPLGARVGAKVLERGGNAVDAAVATAFAMTVVEPFMSTIAGSGTMLVHAARRGETVALDFNGCAPMRAHESMFRVTTGISRGLFAWPNVEGGANERGWLAPTVPGSVAGLSLALERYGTMELRDAIQPAIELARGGFVTDWYQALTTARQIEELAAAGEAGRVYLRNDGRSIYRPPTGMEEGDRASYPDLARSLELIARDGPSAFYRGEIAQTIHDAMAAHGGLITRDDLAAYSVRVGAPLTGTYRGLELAFAPGATGGATALEILNILEQFPKTAVGWHTPGGLNLRALAVRRAFGDRFEHLGDPSVVQAPWQRLTSKDYAREIAAELRRRPVKRGRRAEAIDALGASAAGGDCTTHISVVDRQRNMVALTHTAVSLFGSMVVVPGTGILLNNGMIWFNPEAGRPNSVAPGKRALVNMVPVLGFKKGEPYLTLGAPGGRRIVSAIPQVIATMVDSGSDLQEAIEAPRLHAESAETLVDGRVGERVLAALARLGQRVAAREETYATLNFAKPVGVRVGRRGLEAGLDTLRPAAAAGH
jgi:gamma-glutamyltranspeptidase / glutathione hydrolase